MIDLAFSVVGVRAEAHAAVPTLVFRLQIREAAARPIHNLLLRCQVQIEPRRRRHAPAEQARLTDLFGEPSRWADTLHPLMWTQTTLMVPAFEGSVEVDLPVPCTYDFEVSAAKYLQGLEDGEIPILLFFSGTVFAKAENGFRVELVPWDREAPFRFPVAVWRELMDAYFPGFTWVRLNRETVDALQRFRSRHALTSWDAVVEALLAGAEAPVV